MIDIPFVPERRVFTISIMVTVLVALLIITISAYPPQESEQEPNFNDSTNTATSTNQTTSTTSSNHTESTEDSTNGTQSTVVENAHRTQTANTAPAAEVKLDRSGGPNIPILKILIPIISFILSTMTLGIGYAKIINRDELQQLVNTAARLSGFDAEMPKFGRSWYLTPDVEIHMYSDQTCKITMPILGDPMEFGFRIKDDKAVTISNLDSLQLTLQLVDQYLNSNST